MYVYGYRLLGTMWYLRNVGWILFTTLWVLQLCHLLYLQDGMKQSGRSYFKSGVMRYLTSVQVSCSQLIVDTVRDYGAAQGVAQKVW
jgi:exosortase/archaeosortase